MNAKIFHGSFLLYPVTMMKGRGLLTEDLKILEGSLQTTGRRVQVEYNGVSAKEIRRGIFDLIGEDC